MARAKISSLLIFLLLFITLDARAQVNKDTTNADTEFKLALDLYNSSQYNEALTIFNRIINNYDYNSKTTISYIFAGKSYLGKNDYSDAEKVLTEFISLFPGSGYIDEARLTLSKCYIGESAYLPAFKELASIIESTSSPFYNSYSKSSGEKIALNYMKLGQVKKMYDSVSDSKLKPYLLLLTGKLYIQRGMIDTARSVFSDLVKKYPESEEKSQAATLFQNLKSGPESAASSPIIGVLLPLDKPKDGSSVGPGDEILQGIKFAVAEYNDNHKEKIGLVIRNTERKQETIENIKKEFAALPSLKAVIGPIYSDEVRETLEAFKDTDIPIISPTATDNGLTELYPNFFQANPSFRVRGEVMAQYIYYVVNKRKISVLSAVDGYSSMLANAFIDEFENLGGDILTRQTYHSNTVSLSDQVSKIAADSLTLDGVYLPLSDKRDVPAILSQFVQDSLYVPIYGNQDWFLAKGYETSPELSDKLTFTSDYFIDYNSPLYRDFSKKFFAKTNSDADRNVLYGYDTAEYLLSLMEGNPNAGRPDIKSALESGVIGKGYHNNIYFDSTRVNKFLDIVRYNNGKFELIDKFKAGD